MSLVLLGSASCSDPSGPELAVLAVTPSASEILVGDTLRLSVAGLSAAGDTIRDIPLTWETSDTLVATVSPSGLVTGRGVGAATISAHSGAISGPAGIAVTIHFAAVAAGFDHDCALTAAGAAYCWGANYSGQLGDGTTTRRSAPTAVVGGHRFIALAAGGAVTCGLDADSLAWCWGWNDLGQLGGGTHDQLPHAIPAAVAGSHRFRELRVTGGHSCGVTAPGTAYCWGFNWFGVLGTGAPPDSFTPTPAPVTGGFSFSTVATAPSHTCGVTVGGATLCWGANSSGELGALTDTAFTTPVAVTDTLAFSGLSAGGTQACALAAGGAGICWGTMEIGEGYRQRRHPDRVEPTRTLSQLATEYSTTCGLDQINIAWCWGSNWLGELGDGTQQPRFPGVMVTGGYPFKSVQTGSRFTCGLDLGGAAYCWGSNFRGVLGRGTSGGSSPVPAPVIGNIAFRSISLGDAHACGIAVDSTAWCWGSNLAGQLGDSSTTDHGQPAPVRGGLKFVALAAGGVQYYEFTCGVTTTGAAYCWGDGSGGELGTGSTASSTVPVPVSGGLSFTRITAGGSGNGFACGITADSSAYCWGRNRYGNLGRGDTLSSSVPVAVLGGVKFTEIAAGTAFVCGRSASATVYCWGNNGAGQMGQGSLGIESLRPVPVQGATSFARVAVGQVHSCGLAADSTAWCWGRNQEGQLGTGDSISSLAPRPVVNGLHFKQLALGHMQSCGLTGAGAAYCWGYGRGTTPGAILPGTTFLALSGAQTNKVCGLRADSLVVCIDNLYAAPPPRSRPAHPIEALLKR